MQVCEGPRRNEHTGVCFEGLLCPVCELREELEKAAEKISDLEEQLQNVG